MKKFIVDFIAKDPKTKNVIGYNYPRTIPQAIIGIKKFIKNVVLNYFVEDLIIQKNIVINGHSEGVEYIDIPFLNGYSLISISGDSEDSMCKGFITVKSMSIYRAYFANKLYGSDTHIVTCTYIRRV